MLLKLLWIPYIKLIGWKTSSAVTLLIGQYLRRWSKTEIRKKIVSILIIFIALLFLLLFSLWNYMIRLIILMHFVKPYMTTVTRLQILFPSAFVSLISCLPYHFPFTMLHIVPPISFVLITRWVCHRSKAVFFPTLPSTFVNCPVFVSGHTVTVT